MSDPRPAFRPTEEYPRNMLFCCGCNEPQHVTPGGVCCVNGHGGADGVPRSPKKEGSFWNRLSRKERATYLRHLEEGARILLVFGDDEAANSMPNWPPWDDFYKWKAENDRINGREVTFDV